MEKENEEVSDANESGGGGDNERGDTVWYTRKGDAEEEESQGEFGERDGGDVGKGGEPQAVQCGDGVVCGNICSGMAGIVV